MDTAQSYIVLKLREEQTPIWIEWNDLWNVGEIR